MKGRRRSPPYTERLEAHSLEGWAVAHQLLATAAETREEEDGARCWWGAVAPGILSGWGD